MTTSTNHPEQSSGDRYVSSPSISEIIDAHAKDNYIRESPQPMIEQMAHSPPADRYKELQEHLVSLTENMNRFISTTTTRFHNLEQQTMPSSTPSEPTTEPSRSERMIIERPTSEQVAKETSTRTYRMETPKPFTGARTQLNGFLFQIEKYFVLQKVRNDDDKLAILSLCLASTALDWWRANECRYNTWQDAREALEAYYGDYYQADKAYQEILQLRQTGNVQDYLANIDRLNAYAQISDSELVRIILIGIKPELRRNMAHYESYRKEPIKWRKRLVEMDISTTELRTSTRTYNERTSGNERFRTEQLNSNDRRRVNSNTALSTKSTTSSEYPKLPESVVTKRKIEGRCLKCGKSNHMIKDCRHSNYRLSPPPLSNPIQPSKASTTTTLEQVQQQKRPRTESGSLRLVEIDTSEPLEFDSENE